MPDYQKLKDSIVKCDECKGHGSIRTYTEPDYLKIQFMKGWKKCPKCMGVGYLDWIDNITSRQTKTAIKVRLCNISWTALFFDDWGERINPKKELIWNSDKLEFLTNKQVELFHEQKRLAVHLVKE